MDWRLPQEELDKAASQRDITGPFIEHYLEPSELDIIKYDAKSLAFKLQRNLVSAKQVTLAFCKTAAIAHQIVSMTATSRSSPTDSQKEQQSS